VEDQEVENLKVALIRFLENDPINVDEILSTIIKNWKDEAFRNMISDTFLRIIEGKIGELENYTIGFKGIDKDEFERRKKNLYRRADLTEIMIIEPISDDKNEIKLAKILKFIREEIREDQGFNENQLILFLSIYSFIFRNYNNSTAINSFTRNASLDLSNFEITTLRENNTLFEKIKKLIEMINNLEK
jgi:hypothetical protein